MGPLISNEHRERVCKYIELGIEEKASLVAGGQIPEKEPLTGGAYLNPTLFIDVHNNMQIAREEIFGPVLCVIPFDSEEDAIKIANDTIYGLSGSIWTQDLARALRSINTGHSVHLEAPFGGFKKSGVGRELGLAVLDHYSELKSVFIHVDQ
jgi:betaine-aldehyde dehydrogenase